MPGGLGGIYPAMANSILALRLLGYPGRSPARSWGSSRRSRPSPSRTATMLHYQPCPSPVWDTSLAVNALIESDLPPDHPPCSAPPTG